MYIILHNPSFISQYCLVVYYFRIIYKEEFSLIHSFYFCDGNLIKYWRNLIKILSINHHYDKGIIYKFENKNMECNNKNVAKRVRNRKKRIQTLIKKKEKVQKEKDTVAECFEKKQKVNNHLLS